jgi:transcriptional regulator with XRE-family HTH domain
MPAGHTTQEEGNAVTQHPDTPTSQFTAVRWTFYRRFGLLMRTRLQDDGTTLSLHDVAARTGGRVSVDELIAYLSRGAQAQPDAVTCVLLAQALDVDPDYFVADESIEDYVAGLRRAYRQAAEADGALPGAGSLQQQAAALIAARAGEIAGVAAR